MKSTTKKKTTRKAGIQPGSKKFPKIVTTPSTADELQAVYKWTPAEIAYAKRILDRVARKRSRASK